MSAARLFARFPGTILWAYAIAVFAFLVVPLLIVVPVSFSSGTYLQFPPPGFSLQWYRDYFGDPQWIDATVLSIKIAVCVVVLAISAHFVSLVSATPAAGYSVQNWSASGWLRVDFNEGSTTYSVFATWNGYSPQVQVVGPSPSA